MSESPQPNDPPQPYEPPRAPLRDPGDANPRPLLGLTAGLAIDFGGTIAASIVISIVYASMSKGKRADEIERVMRELPSDSGLYRGIGGGSCFRCSAATCAAAWRRPSPTINILPVLIGILWGGGQNSSGTGVGALGLTFAAVMAGAWLRTRRQARPDAAD
jgi:hypothetical protein